MNLVVSETVILLEIELAKIDSKEYHKLETIISAEVDFFVCPETYERAEKGRKAVAVSRGAFVTPQKIRSDSASSSSLEVYATPEYYKARKMAIYYQFLLYGAPEEEQRMNVNLINKIMINLCIPRGGFLRV